MREPRRWTLGVVLSPTMHGAARSGADVRVFICWNCNAPCTYNVCFTRPFADV